MKYYYKNIDIFRMICAVLIIISHCLPVFGDTRVDLYYGQWFFRFAVPFFFIASGFFTNRNDMRRNIIRIGKIYLVCTMVYIPLILKSSSGTLSFLYNLIYGYRHLWYLSALTFAYIFVWLLNKIFSDRIICAFALALFLSGAFFGSYVYLLGVNASYIERIILLIGGARNGLFMGFPLVVFGMSIRKNEECLNTISRKVLDILLLLLIICSFAEASMFLKFDNELTLDNTIFMPCVSMLLFLYCIRNRTKKSVGGGKDTTKFIAIDV